MDNKKKITVIIIFAIVFLMIGMIFIGLKGNSAKKTQLSFENIRTQEANIIKNDIRTIFGMGAYSEGGILGFNVMPNKFKAEKINDDYDLYNGVLKGEKVVLDGTKVNSYINENFFPDAYIYVDYEGEYEGSPQSSSFQMELINTFDISGEEEFLFFEIKPDVVQYNKERKVYRVSGNVSPYLAKATKGYKALPVVLYIDENYNITDVYYNKTFADMDGKLEKSKIQKGISGINNNQYATNSGETTYLELIEKHAIGQQVTGKNKLSIWESSNQVLLSHRNKVYVDGKLIKDEDKSGEAIAPVIEKEAGGKIIENERIDEKIEDVYFDEKLQLTKVKSKVTVKLEDNKSGSYNITYLIDENYVIRASYFGNNQPE